MCSQAGRTFRRSQGPPQHSVCTGSPTHLCSPTHLVLHTLPADKQALRAGSSAGQIENAGPTLSWIVSRMSCPSRSLTLALSRTTASSYSRWCSACTALRLACERASSACWSLPRSSTWAGGHGELSCTGVLCRDLAAPWQERLRAGQQKSRGLQQLSASWLLPPFSTWCQKGGGGGGASCMGRYGQVGH